MAEYQPQPKAPKAEAKADAELLAALLAGEVAAEVMSAKDRSFVTALLHGPYGYFTRGFLTVKQHGWVKVMLRQLMFPGENAPIPDDLKTPKMLAQEQAKKANRGKHNGAATGGPAQSVTGSFSGGGPSLQNLPKKSGKKWSQEEISKWANKLSF